MKQLVSPNLSQTGTIGYCLQFAREAFGCPAVEPTAWVAWENTQFKHTDPVPTDVSVPIWFSYTENGTNYGHVAINVPGKGILSSPWQQGTNHAWLNSIDELISIYSNNQKNPMAYVGWSEDISKVRVVEDEEMIQDTDNEYGRWAKTSMFIRARMNGDSIVPLTRDEFRANAVGKTWLQVLENLEDDPEADAAMHKLTVGAVAVRDNWEQQIADLNVKVKSLTDQLTAEQAKTKTDVDTITSLVSQLNAAKKEISDLQDQYADKPAPTPITSPAPAPVPTVTLLDRILKWLRLK